MKTLAMLGIIFVACGGSSGPAAPAGGSGGGGTGGTGGAGGVGGGSAGSGGSGGGGSGGSAPADAMMIVVQDAAMPTQPDASPGDAAAPAAALTWDGFARAFFVKYCGACHDDDKKGAATRDYHMLAAVMKEKAEIACGVSKSQADWSKRNCTAFPPARQFPVGNGLKPTDEERDQIVQWIDSGTP
jgi:cytochrome c553